MMTLQPPPHPPTPRPCDNGRSLCCARSKPSLFHSCTARFAAIVSNLLVFISSAHFLAQWRVYRKHSQKREMSVLRRLIAVRESVEYAPTFPPRSHPSESFPRGIKLLCLLLLSFESTQGNTNHTKQLLSFHN